MQTKQKAKPKKTTPKRQHYGLYKTFVKLSKTYGKLPENHIHSEIERLEKAIAQNKNKETKAANLQNQKLGKALFTYKQYVGLKRFFSKTSKSVMSYYSEKLNA